MNPWFKLLVWIGIAWWVGKNIKPIWAFVFLAIFGTIQALIGVAQFTIQGDLGLQVLGESVLDPRNRDVARTFVEGGRLLRAYGTFPHPNILAAFLIISLLSLYYFFIKFSIFNFQFSINFQLKNFQFPNFLYLITLVSGIFTNWLGLLLTFSRAGWLIALITTWLLVLLSYLYDRKDRIVMMELNAVVFLILILLISGFYWAVFPRLAFHDQFSFENRISDYQYAWQKIKEKPILGHGLTLTMGERPIHNLYLTIWVEVGLVGLLIFLIFIFYTLIKNCRPILLGEPRLEEAGKFKIENFSLERMVLLTMFLSLLLFGMFDHFLWTLRPGLAMVCLILGLLAYGPRSSTDRAQVSET